MARLDPRLADPTLLKLAAQRALMKREELARRHTPPAHWWGEFVVLCYQESPRDGAMVLGVALGCGEDQAAALLSLGLPDFLATCGATDVAADLLLPPPEPEEASLPAPQPPDLVEVHAPAPRRGTWPHRPRAVAWSVR